LALLVVLFCVLGLAGGHWGLFDFYGQLQAQALVAALVFMILAAALQRWLWLALLSACVAGLAWAVHPFALVPRQLEPLVGADRPLRVGWANLRNWSTGGESVAQLLAAEMPDIAILTELSANHRAAIQGAEAYRYTSTFPAGSAFDVMLLSRLQPADLRFDYTHGTEFPVMETRFCEIGRATRCLAIIALHAPRLPLPWAALGVPATRRDAMLALAARLARQRLEARDHVLLLGDFNAAPYSSGFRTVLAASGLGDSCCLPAERPVRPLPTWYSTWPGVGLAIDHALISPGVRVVTRRLGPDIGSDHRPLVLDLRLNDSR
jgi:endonuclease/exonuclease/phosphatase (EEP) superfamily protein YafD